MVLDAYTQPSGKASSLALPFLACSADLAWRAWWRWVCTDRRKATEGCASDPRTAQFLVHRALERQRRSLLVYPYLLSGATDTAWICFVAEGLTVLPIGCIALLFQKASGLRKAYWGDEVTADFMEKSLETPWVIPAISLSYLLAPLLLAIGIRGLTPSSSCTAGSFAVVVTVLVARATGHDTLRLGGFVAIIVACWLQLCSVLSAVSELRYAELLEIARNCGLGVKAAKALSGWRGASIQPPCEPVLEAMIERCNDGFSRVGRSPGPSRMELSRVIAVEEPVLALPIVTEANVRLSSLIKGEQAWEPEPVFDHEPLECVEARATPMPASSPSSPTMAHESRGLTVQRQESVLETRVPPCDNAVATSDVSLGGLIIRGDVSDSGSTMSFSDSDDSELEPELEPDDPTTGLHED